jgi:ribose transport system ATP-binding protein
MGGVPVSEGKTILEMKNVDKAFPGVQALDDVSFELRRGEVHALVGENGAGKSTLMKILSGAYTSDGGTIILDGQEVRVRNPRHGQELGISIIYQEFNLEPYLDIAENIFLGREPRGRAGIIDRKTMYARAEDLLSKIGVELDLRAWIKDLPVAEQQMVEIAKALSFEAKVVVMDEPTSALGLDETQRLFTIIDSLKEQGIAIIYITHRIREVFHVADRVTVLKDGEVVGTEDIRDIDQGTLVKMMIGRVLDVIYPDKGDGDSEPILSVRGLTRAGAFEDVTFDLCRGEILGVAGLVGAGRTEVARAIFGADPVDRGEVSLDGRRISIRSPEHTAAQGIGLVPEDRRNHGLVLCLPVRSNVVLPLLERLRRFLFCDRGKETAVANDMISALDIKTPSCEHEVECLSGGNQQKVVLSKWLAAAPQVIIFDEPTRGIDVGAKAEIHRLMRELANQGKGVLMISSELPEILGMSDRILVMSEGRLTATFAADEATEERIMTAATGISTAD